MKTLPFLLLLVNLSLLSGCAVLDRDRQVTAVPHFPRVEQKPAVYVESVEAVLVAHGKETSVAGDLSGEPVYSTLDALCETLAGSGLYAPVVRRKTAAAYTVNFRSETDISKRSTWQAALFIATLGIIPLHEDRMYQLTADLMDNRTGLHKTVQVKETADYWFDTLFLPVGLFLTKPAEVGTGIQKDLNDNMALALHEAILQLPPVVAAANAPVAPVIAAAPLVHPLSAPTRAVAVVPKVVLRGSGVPSKPAAEQPDSALTWPAIVVKGTFVSGGKTLVLLGDGLTLEPGVAAPNGLRLVEASRERVRVAYRGEERTYQRSGGTFILCANESEAVAQP